MDKPFTISSFGVSNIAKGLSITSDYPSFQWEAIALEQKDKQVIDYLRFSSLGGSR